MQWQPVDAISKSSSVAVANCEVVNANNIKVITFHPPIPFSRSLPQGHKVETDKSDARPSPPAHARHAFLLGIFPPSHHYNPRAVANNHCWKRISRFMHNGRSPRCG